MKHLQRIDQQIERQKKIYDNHYDKVTSKSQIEESQRNPWLNQDSFAHLPPAAGLKSGMQSQVEIMVRKNNEAANAA